MSDWTAKYVRHHAPGEEAFDTFREAAAFQSYGLEDGQHAPVSIIAPDCTVAWTADGDESIDDLIERLDREMLAVGRAPIVIRAWIECPTPRREVTITIDDPRELADLDEVSEQRRAELVAWRVEREVLRVEGLFMIGWDEVVRE